MGAVIVRDYDPFKAISHHYQGKYNYTREAREHQLATTALTHDAASQSDLEEVMRLIQKDPQVCTAPMNIMSRQPFSMPLGMAMWSWSAIIWTRGVISMPKIALVTIHCTGHVRMVTCEW